jgi:hypothetical protein
MAQEDDKNFTIDDIRLDADALKKHQDGFHVLIADLFTYHPASDDQIPRYEAIRKKAAELALVLHENCPMSADRTFAMRQLQDCVMTANRSIALKGRSYR